MSVCVYMCIFIDVDEREIGYCIGFSDPLLIWPPRKRRSARLKFCQRKSISLVCQPCNFQPLTLTPPSDGMAYKASLDGGLPVREVQLSCSGDGNLARDDSVSQKDRAHIALIFI